jgi:hypothetical protein
MTQKPPLFSIQPPPYDTVESRLAWLSATSHGTYVPWQRVELEGGRLKVTGEDCNVFINENVQPIKADVTIIFTQEVHQYSDGVAVAYVVGHPAISLRLVTNHILDTRALHRTATALIDGNTLRVFFGTAQMRLTHASLGTIEERRSYHPRGEYGFSGWGLEYCGRGGLGH